MRARIRWLAVASVLGAAAALWVAASPAGAAQPQVQVRPTGTFAASKVSGGPLVHQKIPLAAAKGERPFVPRLPNGSPAVNRAMPGLKSFSGSFAGAPVATNTKAAALAKAAGLPSQLQTFEGLNHFDSRYLSDGFADTQFSLEPPDQGLCAGGGWVVEILNDVVGWYDSATGTLLFINTLNNMFGYAPAFIRPSGPFGPFMTDPSCIFDKDLNRWIFVVLTLDQDPTTGDFTGVNHLDLAVSNPGDPTSGTLFAPGIYTTDDGTNGTPVHANCPCIGDYPHIGADRNGFYISTNEYSFFGTGYNGAQIYALGKMSLDLGPTLFGTMIENASLLIRQPQPARISPGFTVWPSTSPGSANTNADPAYGGTEWFLSTLAGDGSETGNFTGKANSVAAWALRNTQALNTLNPQNVAFSSVIVPSTTYMMPPTSTQRLGNVPLADCITLGCFGPAPPASQGQVIDSGDTRMQQTYYCCGLNGRAYGAASSAVKVQQNQIRAGIAWFALRVGINPATLNARAIMNGSGLIGAFNANLTYPTIAIRPDGKGIMSFSMMRLPNLYPNQGYMGFGPGGPTTPVTPTTFGIGPDDGFTNYAFFVGTPVRTRWGDYGATAVDPDTNHIWAGNEMINQQCDIATFLADTTCGGTRTLLANWSTQLTEFSP